MGKIRSRVEEKAMQKNKTHRVFVELKKEREGEEGRVYEVLGSMPGGVVLGWPGELPILTKIVESRACHHAVAALVP